MNYYNVYKRIKVKITTEIKVKMKIKNLDLISIRI